MSSALAFRRWALVVLPLLAAVLIVAGVFLDPDIDASGRDSPRSTPPTQA